MQFAQMTEGELRLSILDAWGAKNRSTTDMARMLHVFDARGYDTTEFRRMFGVMYTGYLRLGGGQYDADLFHAYGMSPLWAYLRQLPLAEQKRLAATGSVQVVEILEGVQTHREVSLTEVAAHPRIASIVFCHRGIRTIAEQVVYLTQERRRIPPPPLEIVDGYEVDRKKNIVRWARSSTPPAEIPLRVLRVLLGKLEA